MFDTKNSRDSEKKNRMWLNFAGELGKDGEYIFILL